jgi:hypothetical protein
MGSIFGDSTLQKRSFTTRQHKYFATKKTNRKVVKNEQHEQIRICEWLRETLPTVHFRCDTASGGFSSSYEKATHMRQQSSESEPDIMIFAARQGYHGLLIELKSTGTELRMKRDGRTMRVYKDAKGRIVSRDYKIRKKGDWASLHIEKQAKVLEDYQKNWGYFACFAVGETEARRIISRYFGLQFTDNTELF